MPLGINSYMFDIVAAGIAAFAVDSGLAGFWMIA